MEPPVPSMSHKVCLLGDPSSGKTDFIRPFVKESFEDAYINTVGSKVSKRDVTRTWPTPRGPLLATSSWILWDIAGQRTFEKVIAAYTRAASGAIVVVSPEATDPGASARYWGTIARRAAGNGPVLFFFLVPQGAAPVAQLPPAVDEVARECGADCILVRAGGRGDIEAALIMFGEKLVQHYLGSHPRWPDEATGRQATQAPARSAGRRRKKRA